MRSKKYSEELLTAFLECGSIREIQARTGLSHQSINKYRKDSTFRDELARRKLASIQAAVNRLQTGLTSVVETVLSIATDEKISPQIRLNGCQIALSQCRSWTEVADVLQRLEAVEQALNDEKLTNSGVQL